VHTKPRTDLSCGSWRRTSKRSQIFRKDNSGAFKSVFRQFGLLCRQLGLWGSEVVAIDGTKLKAVNTPARNHMRGELKEWLEPLDSRMDAYLQRLDELPARGACCTAGAAGGSPCLALRVGAHREQRDLAT